MNWSTLVSDLRATADNAAAYNKARKGAKRPTNEYMLEDTVQTLRKAFGGHNRTVKELSSLMEKERCYTGRLVRKAERLKLVKPNGKKKEEGADKPPTIWTWIGGE